MRFRLKQLNKYTKCRRLTDYWSSEDKIAQNRPVKEVVHRKISALQATGQDLRQIGFDNGLTREISTDDLLDNIFSKFCIGK